jgi:cephalosporin hydroxylase
MNDTAFKQQVRDSIEALGRDEAVHRATDALAMALFTHRYAYNFHFMGRPIIQVPQDMVAIQELIWEVRPDLIIETGIARGGSLVLSAAMLALLDLTDAAAAGGVVDPARPGRRVLGIDIEIRPHNRAALDAHPMRPWIDLVEGSSISTEVIERVREAAAGRRVMVCLDSNHTHDHVLAELRAYAPLVAVGNYCVVFDTRIEDMPDANDDRPWGKGNNPKTAVWEFLKERSDFEIDTAMQSKLVFTSAPDGFLRRVR